MLGWPEILLILMVMLLVFGPSKLPEMAKSLGQAFKEFQSATSTIEKEAKGLKASLPDLNASPLTSTPTIKKRALESRQALIAKAADATQSSEVSPAAPSAQVGEMPPPPKQEIKAVDAGNLAEAAKVLGIGVEGKTEEDLKIAIREKIEGLDEKEV